MNITRRKNGIAVVSTVEKSSSTYTFAGSGQLTIYMDAVSLPVVASRTAFAIML
jgi:hypothetical protein